MVLSCPGPRDWTGYNSGAPPLDCKRDEAASQEFVRKDGKRGVALTFLVCIKLSKNPGCAGGSGRDRVDTEQTGEGGTDHIHATRPDDGRSCKCRGTACTGRCYHW